MVISLQPKGGLMPGIEDNFWEVIEERLLVGEVEREVIAGCNGMYQQLRDTASGVAPAATKDEVALAGLKAVVREVMRSVVAAILDGMDPWMRETTGAGSGLAYLWVGRLDGRPLQALVLAKGQRYADNVADLVISRWRNDDSAAPVPDAS
jgi:hypothetical protein